MTRRRKTTFNKQNWLTLENLIFVVFLIAVGFGLRLLVVTCKSDSGCFGTGFKPEATIELKGSTVYAASNLPGETSSNDDAGLEATATVSPSPSQIVVTSDVTAEYGTEKEKGTTPTLPPVKTDELTVKRQICDVFKSDCDRALQVVRCESGFNPKAKNNQPGSTASGLFQIVRPTWRLYKCEGDPFNPKDNAICAKKIYDRNHGKFNTGGGWEASHRCHKQD